MPLPKPIWRNSTPSPRKIDGTRVIHVSWDTIPYRYLFGMSVLCDFGMGRIRKSDSKAIGAYRAPGVIIQIQWDEKVDIWYVGTMIWEMLRNSPLFDRICPGGGTEVEEWEENLLASMIARLLGSTPADFLRRSDNVAGMRELFDEDGKYARSIPRQ
ncbi:hypothetical protein DXG01_000806 [Tephrocybe rancida]|nr:hypothetical protein DXG01_000806 [Tephrocybe rancida]